MWQNVLDCILQRETAICIPLPWADTPFPIYWYGVLAALGIFLGAFYAGRHVEREGGDPETVWDALLWLLLPGLLGARLWYVAQLAFSGSTQYSIMRPLEILNPRLGGMNILGGVVVAMIAAIIYVRIKKLDFWLLADGGLMGLFIGHGVGRFGNWVNQELYGPPIEVEWLQWLGVRIPEGHRMWPWADMEAFPFETTRFHPTFFYEAFWLFLCFGVLYYLYRRHQERVVPGMLTGGYLILSGIGRFIIETWRPDQPLFPGASLSFSRILSLIYVVIGVIVLLDRLGHMRIPFVRRPITLKQRERALRDLRSEQRRTQRRSQRVQERRQRAKEREKREKEAAAKTATEQAEETTEGG